MTDEKLYRLESFRTFIKAAEEGAAIRPVTEEDLKRLHEICTDRAKRYPGSDGAVSIDFMASVCSSVANLPAVWLRHTQVELLVKQGILAEWQHGAALDEAVYEVAATIPINGFHLDHKAFLRRLRYRAAA